MLLDRQFLAQVFSPMKVGSAMAEVVYWLAVDDVEVVLAIVVQMLVSVVAKEVLSPGQHVSATPYSREKVHSQTRGRGHPTSAEEPQ